MPRILAPKKKWSSVIVAPLIARDMPLGAIVCCLQGSRRQFEPADVALIENLASRAATALDNAQLFQTIRDGERRKDEFLAMLGHELRNPLAAITNAGELTKLLEPGGADLSRIAGNHSPAGALMKRLVDDLLDVSRITSGRVQLQKSIVDAARVRHSSRGIERLVVHFSRPHSFIWNIPEATILLEADPYRLEQILSNLLVNAAKYTDPGGEIWFGALAKDGDVVFRVKDTGIGIGPDLLPNVFDLVRAGESLAAPGGRRPGHWPDDRPRADRAARRPGLGDQRRFWSRRRVCRLPAGENGRDQTASCRQPIRYADDNVAAAANSGRRGSAGAVARHGGVARRSWGTKCVPPPTGRKLCWRCENTTRKSCCSISACPAWMATKWHAACVAKWATTRRCW